MLNLKSKIRSAIGVTVFFGAFGVLAANVQDVVSAVSYDRYRSYLGYPGDTVNPLYTQAGDNRYYTSNQHNLARTNIVNHFIGLGLTTPLDSFTYSGSTYSNYASAAKARGDTIRGMISLDMVAYNTAEIYGRTTSDTVKLALAEAVQTYGGLTPTVSSPLDYSDHASFEANGYPAALLISLLPHCHRQRQHTQLH